MKPDGFRKAKNKDGTPKHDKNKDSSSFNTTKRSHTTAAVQISQCTSTALKK